MIFSASEALRLTDANVQQTESFLLQQEMYNIQREIIKAIRKGRYNTQLTYSLTAEATLQLTTALYSVTVNQYGTVISWD